MPISFWLVALVPCVLHCPMISRGRKRKHPTENPSEFAPRNTSIPIASLADYANTSGETWLLASSGMAPRKGVSPRRGGLTSPPALGRQPLTGQGLFFQMPPGMSRGNMGRGASFNVSGWRPDSPTPTRPDPTYLDPDPTRSRLNPKTWFQSSSIPDPDHMHRTTVCTPVPEPRTPRPWVANSRPLSPPNKYRFPPLRG